MQTLIDQQRLGEVLEKRYPDMHNVTSDKALYDYTLALKNRYLRNAAPLNKVIYDSKIRVIKHALGLHTAVSQIQGGKLKASGDPRRQPVPSGAGSVLRMIVVHELAHIKGS